VSHQLRNGIKCRSKLLPVSGISPPLCAIGGSRWPNRPSTRLLANMRMLDDKDVVCLLRSEVERAGGQSAWARREWIDRTLVNRVLCGQKPPAKEIVRALKLCNLYALHGR
jgi:hypothetical protein